jgi:glycerophosphoryl diester phosphodiesterase
VFLDGDHTIAFAHRGFARGGDENSLAAFQRAVDAGARYLETDVRVTRDGVPVAFHDASLDRVTDGRGRIDQLPWEIVRRARIAGREPVALLADVLTCWPAVRVNIDVKSRTVIPSLVTVIRRTASHERVCIAAFSTSRVAAVRTALGPSVCTAYGPAAVMALRAVGVARGRGARCVQAPARVAGRPFISSRFVAAATARGLPVHAYTVNDENEMHRLLDLGVRGLMTDRFDVLRTVLTERGEWS